MNSNSQTNSIKAIVTAIALSATSITTTLNTSGVMYTAPQVIMKSSSENGVGSSTMSPTVIKTNTRKNFENAAEIFSKEMRDFTLEEANSYQESIDNIYKPIGVNILDLC